MKNKLLLKTRTYFLILLLALFSAIANNVKAQSNQVITAARLYDSLRSHSIEHPKTVLAIAIYETGWMRCKSCALQQNNLFGFRTNADFLKFADIYESIKYLKRWQTRYYEPWKLKHPEGTYYEYLKYIGYCDNMDSYIKNIKSIEQWISVNIEEGN
jgi:hypothetical protein